MIANNESQIAFGYELRKAQEEKESKEVVDALAGSTVAICGLGGLGSNIAMMLSRAGVGRLILTDFDTVNITNLHRQFYKISQLDMKKAWALSDNLAEIAPLTRLELHDEKISPDRIKELLTDADVICEAFDNAEQKAMLVGTVLEVFPDTDLVAASGMAGTGDANDIITRQISEHFYLCGDFHTDVGKADSLLPSRVMVCAAHQAHKIIQLLIHKKAAANN
ncbi:thiamine biosynthesis protein ThiF [Butyrivibrio fibrisolvens]|uniref:thiamine biosynthesis protein ThiF n=1 Tax=Butyrivibrio fibrisolvens TaxID=831 RepID=UPI0003B59B74|nr:thiamine biosynthesis protein ThiF [Butyrivibrio fibrisolvens]